MKKVLSTILALTFLIGIALFAYRDCFFSQDGFAQYDSDYQVQDLPATEFLKLQAQANNSCLWNPLILCGVPFFDHCEVGFFYPLNIIFQSLLSADMSYRISCLIHILLTALGLFIYVKHLTDKLKPAIVAVSVFILCGPTMALMVNCNADALFTLSWLPWILWLTEKFINNRKSKYLFFISLCLGMSVLAGELQMFSYMLIFYLIYLAYAVKRKNVKGKPLILRKLCSSLLWGLLIGSVQIIPTLKLSLRSIRLREYSTAISDALPLDRAIDLIFPELIYFYNNPVNNSFVLYFGILAMFFVIWSIIKERKFIAPFVIMTAFLILSAFGLTIYRLYYHFFPFAKYVHGGEEAIFPVGIMVAVAAGLGWNQFQSNSRISPRSKQIIFLCLIVECMLLNNSYIKGVIRHNDRANLHEEKKIVNIIKQDYQQERIVRIKNSGLLLPNVLMPDNIYDVEGFYPFVIKEYAELLQGIDKKMVSGPGGPGKNIDITDLSDKNSLDSPLINMLNVKYIISPQHIHREGYKLLYNGKIKLYDNLSVLPRAFLLSNWQVIKDKSELLLRITKPSFNPLDCVYLEENPAWVQTEGEAAACLTTRAIILDYKPDKMVIETCAKEKGLLFISDTYYPGWQAYLDGELTKIYRANHAFRAVAVPKGRHIVTFYYLPTVLKIGSMISIVALIFAVKQLFV
ncbi:YfhO family protein [Candidatus Omnitrophota bacterium]